MMPVCCSSRGWLLLVVAVAASAPYLSSLQGGFVFDDHEAVESNLDVRWAAIKYGHALLDGTN